MLAAVNEFRSADDAGKVNMGLKRKHLQGGTPGRAPSATQKRVVGPSRCVNFHTEPLKWGFRRQIPAREAGTRLGTCPPRNMIGNMVLVKGGSAELSRERLIPRSSGAPGRAFDAVVSSARGHARPPARSPSCSRAS